MPRTLLGVRNRVVTKETKISSFMGITVQTHTYKSISHIVCLLFAPSPPLPFLLSFPSLLPLPSPLLNSVHC